MLTLSRGGGSPQVASEVPLVRYAADMAEHAEGIAERIAERRRVSFDARAELYDEVRPAYPDVLAADVLERAAPGRTARMLEIGAGTGKATLVFAHRGAVIVALEPGPRMAAVLRYLL